LPSLHYAHNTWVYLGWSIGIAKNVKNCNIFFISILCANVFCDLGGEKDKKYIALVSMASLIILYYNLFRLNSKKHRKHTMKIQWKGSSAGINHRSKPVMSISRRRRPGRPAISGTKNFRDTREWKTSMVTSSTSVRALVKSRLSR